MMRLRRPAPASLRRRALAATIDGLAWLGPFGVLGALGAAWPDHSVEQATELVTGRRVTRALGVAAPIASVALRNVATPGQRVAGIRRVDAANGGPVTLPSAIARQLLALAWRLPVKLVVGPFGRRSARASTAWHEEFERITAEHPDDEEARDAALEAAHPGCSTSCLGFTTAGAAANLVMPLSSLRSPRGQTYIDRLSGTILVQA